MRLIKIKGAVSRNWMMSEGFAYNLISRILQKICSVLNFDKGSLSGKSFTGFENQNTAESSTVVFRS